MKQRAGVVICGAGIAGASAAYFLARAGAQDILLIDERPPLTLTSDHSTECYRNWWPDPEMRAFMDHSIDLMEDLARASANVFRMNRRGYLYITGDRARLSAVQEEATQVSASGAGPLRIHSSAQGEYRPLATEFFEGQPVGADLLLGTSAVQSYFPFIGDAAVAALHVRRAGWLSAQQLGMHLFEQARLNGARFRSGRVMAVETRAGRVEGVVLEDDVQVDCDTFVIAAGPFLSRVGSLCGLDVPVQTEVHLKVAFEDTRHVVSRDSPLLIWNDPQLLPWSNDERRLFGAEPELAWLTEEFPAGAHTRPEGNQEGSTVLMLWDYRNRVIDPVLPVPLDSQYPEIALRGLCKMLPGLAAYVDRAARPHLDGGYYTRTRENRPLIGPTPLKGAYVIGALSGYGIMSACAAGELLASHILGGALPSYAPAFSPGRYDDAEYLRSLGSWQGAGEL